MVFRILGLSILMMSAVSYAQGRKPAVEDFVGIEVQEPDIIPQGTEALYNFEQDLTDLAIQKSRPPKKRIAPTISENKSWSHTTIFAFSMLAGLPLMIWLMVMSHLKKKASIESASNIEVLEKYRKERERKMEEKTRKAS